MNKKAFFINLGFSLLSFIIIWVLRDEILVSISLMVLLGVVFFFHREPREWIVFLVGLVLGVLLEVGSDQILKLQYWSEGMLLGVPLWLPLLWGLGFILIRRLGNSIVKY
ncbi:hypothetical protein GOV04_05130 [Candidatus Woesearchaeota archaeon]|nr:hypothetical protein [Candidatus Woesearchaeota archaeon]